MNKFDNELSSLFHAYTESVTVPEPSANFMPELWERIEVRRNFAFRLRRLTQVFVGTAAALCLLMTGMTVISSPSASRPVHATYVDALAAEIPADNLTAIGILPRSELGDANR